MECCIRIKHDEADLDDGQLIDNGGPLKKEALYNVLPTHVFFGIFFGRFDNYTRFERVFGFLCFLSMTVFGVLIETAIFPETTQETFESVSREAVGGWFIGKLLDLSVGSSVVVAILVRNYDKAGKKRVAAAPTAGDAEAGEAGAAADGAGDGEADKGADDDGEIHAEYTTCAGPCRSQPKRASAAGLQRFAYIYALLIIGLALAAGSWQRSRDKRQAAGGLPNGLLNYVTDYTESCTLGCPTDNLFTGPQAGRNYAKQVCDEGPGDDPRAQRYFPICNDDFGCPPVMDCVCARDAGDVADGLVNGPGASGQTFAEVMAAPDSVDSVRTKYEQCVSQRFILRYLKSVAVELFVLGLLVTYLLAMFRLWVKRKALRAAGVAFLKGAKAKLDDTKAAAVQKLDDTKAAAQAKVDEAKDMARAKVDEAKAAAQARVDEARDKAKAGLLGAVDGLKARASAALSIVSQNPGGDGGGEGAGQQPEGSGAVPEPDGDDGTAPEAEAADDGDGDADDAAAAVDAEEASE